MPRSRFLGVIREPPQVDVLFRQHSFSAVSAESKSVATGTGIPHRADSESPTVNGIGRKRHCHRLEGANLLASRRRIKPRDIYGEVPRSATVVEPSIEPEFVESNRPFPIGRD